MVDVCYRKQQVTNGLDESRAGKQFLSHGMWRITLSQLESKISNELAALKQGIETMEKVLQISYI